MVYQSLGNGYYIWRYTNCSYKETLASLIVDSESLHNLVNTL